MATSGFASETSASYHTPHTPPYTPRTPRRTKRPLSRNDSPASVRSAVQADSTESPAKKAAKREIPDEVTVEELSESDVGYIADSEVVLPSELEEAESESSDSEDDVEDHTVESTSEYDEITNQLSRLDCEDGEVAEFERKRRQKHVRRRTESRVFKRPHNLTINAESEVTDAEAMADQDLPGSARRLRRRTLGPDGVSSPVRAELRSSPDSGSGLAPAAADRDDSPIKVESHDDAMEKPTVEGMCVDGER